MQNFTKKTNKQKTGNMRNKLEIKILIAINNNLSSSLRLLELQVLCSVL